MEAGSSFTPSYRTHTHTHTHTHTQTDYKYTHTNTHTQIKDRGVTLLSWCQSLNSIDTKHLPASCELVIHISDIQGRGRGGKKNGKEGGSNLVDVLIDKTANFKVL